MLTANRKVGLLTVSLRPSSVYGEGGESHIPRLVRAAREGRANWQIGDGKARFDNTYVKNLTHAQILAAEALLRARGEEPLPDDRKVEGEAFVVTDDDANYSFAQFARKVAEFAGHPVREQDIRTIPAWLAVLAAYVVDWVYWIVTFGKNSGFPPYAIGLLTVERSFDISKIKKRLGYRARFTPAEGMKRGVDWFIENEGRGGVEKKAQ